VTAPPPHGSQPVAALGVPLDRARAAMIMVHGRGAGPEDMLGLARVLLHPGFAYLAPEAAGGTWYPQSFLAPIPANEPGITSGIAVVHELIDRAVASGVPLDRIILLGFSQGACLATTAAYRRPARYGGIVALSGGLIGPPGTTWPSSGSFDGAPAFLGCSDVDPHIPLVRVDETAAVLQGMGAAVTRRIYPRMGHTVNEDEIGFTRGLMEQIAGG
jgi:phospholipase/carboxylesterase/glyoxalase family protein